MSSRISMFRPALAGVLVLMSASAVVAEDVATARLPTRVFNVTGALSGNAIGSVQAGILHASGSGTGTASQIGQFRHLIQASVNMTGSSEGVFLLVFSNGDVIYGSVAGQGDSPPPAPPNPTRITEELTITGGTGRFERASGSFTFNRLVDLSTLPAYDSHSGTLTGTISILGSRK
jgi:hypothetical protein